MCYEPVPTDCACSNKVYNLLMHGIETSHESAANAPTSFHTQDDKASGRTESLLNMALLSRNRNMLARLLVSLKSMRERAAQVLGIVRRKHVAKMIGDRNGNTAGASSLGGW